MKRNASALGAMPTVTHEWLELMPLPDTNNTCASWQLHQLPVVILTVGNINVLSVSHGCHAYIMSMLHSDNMSMDKQHKVVTKHTCVAAAVATQVAGAVASKQQHNRSLWPLHSSKMFLTQTRPMEVQNKQRCLF